MSDRYMTMAEIETAYPNEWVLLEDVKVGRGPTLLGGRVTFHHREADPVYERAGRRPPNGGTISVRYTGQPDPDEICLL